MPRSAGFRVLLVLALSLVAASVAPGAQKDDPEGVVRALVAAMYANDTAAYERLTVPDPRRARLTSGGSVNRDKLRQLKEDPDGLQIREVQPFTYRGEPAVPDKSGVYPPGTTVRYMAAHYGSPMIVTLVRKPEGWKVDVRWWLAMMDAASGVAPKPGSPEHTARGFMAALIAMSKERAGRFVVPPVNLDLLFAGAPSSREPSGHLDALVEEMGLVEIGAGEFARLPSGRVVEGGGPEDRKVLVGQFGPIDVPFVLRRVGAEWKVLGEPYFLLLNQ